MDVHGVRHRPRHACDEGGVFTSEGPRLQGMLIFDANRYVVADLREQSGPDARAPPRSTPVLVRESVLLPALLALPQALMYKLRVLTWFVRVTQIATAWSAQQEITWTPAHQGRHLRQKWLEGARDWSICVTASGVRRSPCGCRTIRSIRARTSTAPIAELGGRLRRSRTSTVPSSTL